jgi:cell division protein ZapA
VKIFDRNYTLAVDEASQDRLLRAVEMVDARMREIKGAGKLGSLDRIAVLAALQFANEILGIREDAANARAEAIAAAPESLARLRRMNDAVEAEIRRQESLF